MGGVIIDGMTKLLAVAAKEKLAAFDRDIATFKKNATQQKGMKMQIHPLAEGTASVITLRFKGSIEAFDDAMASLNKWRSSMAIDTVPLLESAAIGTWPTPEQKASKFAWVIRVGGK